MLTPAEVAALFRVDPKTVTRWAQDRKLSSIRTVGGHRRYHASEVYELLNSERLCNRRARLEALVNDHYDGDPTSALLDIGGRYGLAIAVLDRAWFARLTQRDLTDLEWKQVAAQLESFSSALREACGNQLLDYAATVLGAAGIPLSHSIASEVPPLPIADRDGQDTEGSVTLFDATSASTSHEKQDSSGAGVPALTLDDVDQLVPHSARVWDYVLGGSDHYRADREAADTFQEVYPFFAHLMVSQRTFKCQAIEYLTKQEVRQFIDIGPGLPSSKSLSDTHIVARSETPDARTLYVDNDPLVSIRIRELIVRDPGCGAGLVHVDVADTETFLAGAARHLDLDQPVGVLLIGVMGYIDDTEEAYAVVRRLMHRLAPGSYLALSDAIATRSTLTWAQETYNSSGATPYRLRTPSQIAEFFTDLDPVSPGLVSPGLWRPSRPYGGINTDVRCAVARTRVAAAEASSDRQ